MTGDLHATKPYLRQYIESQGITIDSNNKMLCPFHADHTPSMVLNDDHTAHCFACGWHGDLINFIEAFEHLSKGDAIKRAFEVSGITPDPRSNPYKTRSRNANNNLSFIKNAAEHFDDPACIDYLKSRGFTDVDLPMLKKFGIGYAVDSRLLVIPHDSGYYTARPVYECRKEDRFRFNARGTSRLFNKHAAEKEMFVVTEGAIDALSIISLGFDAVGLPGVQNSKQLLKYLATKEDEHPRVIIAFDNDQAGYEACIKLQEKLKELCINSIRLPLGDDVKDVNDLFQLDRTALHQTVIETMQKLEQMEEIRVPLTACPLSSNDVDLADFLVRDFLPDAIRYNSTLGKYLINEGPVWRHCLKDSELAVYVTLLREWLRGSENPIKQAAYEKLRISGGVSSVISANRGVPEIYIKSDQLNKRAMSINCLNGVVDLKTYTFHPHDPSHLWTKIANVTYDPNAKSEIWDRFIESVIPDEQSRLDFQKYMGYCLSGSVEEEKALFVVGKGGNGKGTLFRTVMEIMGDYAVPLKIDALLRGNRNGAQDATPEFAKLEGVRLAIAEEIPKNGELDVAQFKLLTGGDPLPVRRLYEDASVIRDVSHKLILSGNSLPELEDPNDDGFMRRLMVIKFEQHFDDKNRDPKLKQKLLQPEVKSAIFNWLIEGCVLWQECGLTESEKMKKAREDYLLDNDYLLDFVAVHCKRGSEYRVRRKELLAAIKREGDSHLKEKSEKLLTEMIEELDGVDYVVDRNNGNYFIGLRLITIEEKRAKLQEYTAAMEKVKKGKKEAERAAASAAKAARELEILNEIMKEVPPPTDDDAPPEIYEEPPKEEKKAEPQEEKKAEPQEEKKAKPRKDKKAPSKKDKKAKSEVVAKEAGELGTADEKEPSSESKEKAPESKEKAMEKAKKTEKNSEEAEHMQFFIRNLYAQGLPSTEVNAAVKKELERLQASRSLGGLFEGMELTT